MRGIVRSATQRELASKKNAALLLELALSDSELWHTQDGTAYVTIRRDGHREHLRVGSGAYKHYLSRQFYDQKKTAPGSQVLTDALNVLEGKAKFDGPTYPLSLRVAKHDHRIYIDLVDDAWRAIEIDAEGWRIVEEPPVRFRRAKGMLSLPIPERDGSVQELRQFVNVTDEGWTLFLGWLIATFRPTGPFPILKMKGEQGDGKTTSTKAGRGLIDPNTAPVRSPPRSDRDLMIAANNGWIVAYDNMSYVSPELSDALCRLSTGGGFATRTLYTDDEETILVAERPIILNGIEDVGIRSDLLDRSLIIELPRIEKGNRQTEEEFWEIGRAHV